MTSPLSRIRSITSARPLGLGARWTPDAPLVVSAVLLMPLLPAAFPRRFASVRTRPQLLLEDALDRDFDDPPDFDRPRLADRDDDPPPGPRLRREPLLLLLALLELLLLELLLLRLELLLPDAVFD